MAAKKTRTQKRQISKRYLSFYSYLYVTTFDHTDQQNLEQMYTLSIKNQSHYCNRFHISACQAFAPETPLQKHSF